MRLEDGANVALEKDFLFSAHRRRRERSADER
jgi:hypothetical protein